MALLTPSTTYNIRRKAPHTRRPAPRPGWARGRARLVDSSTCASSSSVRSATARVSPPSVTRSRVGSWRTTSSPEAQDADVELDGVGALAHGGCEGGEGVLDQARPAHAAVADDEGPRPRAGGARSRACSPEGAPPPSPRQRARRPSSSATARAASRARASAERGNEQAPTAGWPPPS